MSIEHVPESEDLDGLTRDEVAELVVSESDMEAAYGEFLREVSGETVRIAGYDYDVVTALKEVDPIAYRVGYADYVSEYFREIDLGDFPRERQEDTDELGYDQVQGKPQTDR